MDTTSDAREPDPTAVPGDAAGDASGSADASSPLRRSSTHRLVAGVAGGIAERFDVDPAIVRIAFVVVTCIGGLGAVIYLAAWALIPTDGQGMPVHGPGGPCEETGEPGEPAKERSPLLTGLMIAGAVCIGLIFGSPWWGGASWNPGIGVLWVLGLSVLAVAVLRRPRRTISVGRILAVTTLVALTMVIVVTSLFFGAEAMTGVPLRGGVGNREWRPTSVAQVQPTYRLAIGNMTLDLRQVPFRGGTVHVTASVGVGRLLVEVPPGVSVSLTANSGIGAVVYGPGGPQYFLAPAGVSLGVGQATGPASRLVLSAETGVGQVQLVRRAADTGMAIAAEASA